MSEDLTDVLTGQSLPMHSTDFHARCKRLGFDLTKSTALALEAGDKITYGDKVTQVTHPRSLSASGKQKVVARIEAASNGRAAYDATRIEV
jgi:ligand-binding SRPBCC domain-containing protein